MAVSALDDHLVYWLRYVSGHASHSFARRIAARDVTVAEWVMLRELFDRDDVAPSALAERLGMTRGAISKLADRLVEKALVTRSASADDRRSHALALTPEGRELVPALAALADENDRDFFGHLSLAERTVMEAALKSIVRRKSLRVMPPA